MSELIGIGIGCEQEALFSEIPSSSRHCRDFLKDGMRCRALGHHKAIQRREQSTMLTTDKCSSPCYVRVSNRGHKDQHEARAQDNTEEYHNFNFHEAERNEH